MAKLRPAHEASINEIMAFIEREKFYGLGCGFVDLALSANACITPDASLWTLDKRLAGLARRMGVEHQASTRLMQVFSVKVPIPFLEPLKNNFSSGRATLYHFMRFAHVAGINRF